MDFILRERGRRFVHYQITRSGSEGARDFDQLLLRHRELAHFRIAVNLGADALEESPARGFAIPASVYDSLLMAFPGPAPHSRSPSGPETKRRLLVNGRNSRISRGSGIHVSN